MADLRKAVDLLKQNNWEAAHTIVQEDSSDLGSWAHAIVHLLEGDQANAEYWFRRADRSAAQPADVPGEIRALEARLEQGS